MLFAAGAMRTLCCVFAPYAAAASDAAMVHYAAFSLLLMLRRCLMMLLYFMPRRYATFFFRHFAADGAPAMIAAISPLFAIAPCCFGVTAVDTPPYALCCGNMPRYLMMLPPS